MKDGGKCRQSHANHMPTPNQGGDLPVSRGTERAMHNAGSWQKLLVELGAMWPACTLLTRSEVSLQPHPPGPQTLCPSPNANTVLQTQCIVYNPPGYHRPAEPSKFIELKTHNQSYTRPWTHTHINASCKHSHTCTCTHARAHTYAHAHKRARKHTHKHMRTCCWQ